jgi:7-keto-8-aminopelargonate synthetase-like enzyme
MRCGSAVLNPRSAADSAARHGATRITLTAAHTQADVDALAERLPGSLRPRAHRQS